MRLTQCKVKNKDVAGSSFSPIMRHHFSDGRVIPLFLLLLSSLPTIQLTIKDEAIWNFFWFIYWFLSKTGFPGCTKFSRKTRKLLKLKWKLMDMYNNYNRSDNKTSTENMYFFNVIFLYNQTAWSHEMSLNINRLKTTRWTAVV